MTEKLLDIHQLKITNISNSTGRVASTVEIVSWTSTPLAGLWQTKQTSIYQFPEGFW